MMDLLRNLRKPEAEKRQELLTAYLDGALTPTDHQRFEAQMAADTALRDEVVRQRQVKAVLSGLPRQRAPRNFTLNPAVYGKPAPQPAVQLYPALRLATALTAFFFIITLALDVLVAGGPVQSLALGREPLAAEPVAVLQAPEVAEDAAATAALPTEEAALMLEAAEEPAAEQATVAGEAVEEAAIEVEGDASQEALRAYPAPEIAAGEAITSNRQVFGITTTETLTDTTALAEAYPPLPEAAVQEAPTAQANDVAAYPVAQPPAVPETPARVYTSLLVAEIALGVGFLLLFVTVLLIRRRVR